MLEKQYATEIYERLRKAEETQMDAIKEAARLIARSIQNDGLLHLFGCGHSHLLVEEVFYRAGGLVPINPIFESSAMLHEGAVKSSKIERMQGYAVHILDNYILKEGEVILLISNSGINSLPIEMAIEAKKKGLQVIALTSSAYLQYDSRHPSGKKLYELADIVINNQLPYGDALVEVPNTQMKMGPGSTVIGAFLINLLMVSIVEELQKLDVEPPIFVSGNVEGGMESNQKHIKQYQGRIKHL
ncbi:SIS domain-containing protein [Planococcus shixiaomingii]|uniref:SIS domain-containing protein n=1 Tax=Planococcus shixiaomingii TaxID=3058393 RepID=UPI002633E3FB|nr:SIS domain-containing protein [Planococcus sp. N022]WKA55493.1 SIS domain-containing protein [Planococcus sp. N022]